MREVATLDRRDFRVVRPRHIDCEHLLAISVVCFQDGGFSSKF